MKLKDKIAVVTGGTKGIGKSISIKLALEGAQVYAFGRNLPESFSDFSDNSDLEGKIKFIKADVSDSNSVNNAIDTIIEESGTVDILVNNAGVTKDNLMLRMNEDDWNAVMDINLKGTFICSKAVTKPMMKQRKGKIINIGSVVGTIGNAGQANYAASKSGIIGFTKSLSKELGSRNIAVNCISPGYVKTAMTDKLNDEQKQYFIDNISLKRIAEPEEIANVVAFFASDDSNYITGQVLHVDGGLAY